jgi:hypothetical protein
MKVIELTALFLSIFVTIIFISCDPKKSTNPVESDILVGQWEGIFHTENYTSTLIISFDEQNIFYLEESSDDSDYLFEASGEYKIIIKNLVEINLHQAFMNGEPMDLLDTNIDTTIYWVDGNKLEISQGAISYIQISGQSSQLTNGIFYTNEFLSEYNSYNHYRYTFWQDSAEIASASSDNSQMPASWEAVINVGCEITNREISFHIMDLSVVLYNGYFFTLDKLFMGKKLMTFTRI